MRLLLAEDDRALRDVLVRGLSRHGYAVDAVGRGDEALELLRFHDYAVAVFDWRMPGGTGLEVIQSMRRRQMRLPVLMLTARDAPVDRVEGLDGGADDYLVKPFDFDELLARLRALQRRQPATMGVSLELSSLMLNPATRVVSIRGVPLSVTRTEFSILELLLRRAPAVVARTTIAAHAWSDETDPLGSNTIDKHMARLRPKLTGSGVRLVTVRGVGYRLVVVAS